MTERRRVRVVLDCEVEINEITTAAIQARQDEWFRARVEEGYVPEYVPGMPSDREISDAAVLQQAIRADPATLKAWILHEVAAHLDDCGVEQARPTEDVEEEILKPVIENLPPAQRHRFREAMARDEFWQLSEELYWSFVVRIRGLEFGPVADADGA